MLSLRHLSHITAVAEAGSLAAASEILGISPPSLSKSIRSLEQQLGTPLFDRTGRVLKLTRFGQEFAAEARRMVARASSLERNARSVARGEAGTVSIGAGPIPVEVFLPRALSRVACERPSLRIDVRDGTWPELSEMLLDYALHFIVVDPDDFSHSPQRDNFRMESLKPLEVGFFCRPGHPLLHNNVATVADAMSYPVACPRVPEHYKHELIEMAEAEGVLTGEFLQHVQEMPDVHLDNFSACLEFVRGTDHVAPAPVIIARRLLEQGRVVRHPRFVLQTRLAVVTHAKRSLSVAARLLIDEVIETAGSL